MSKIENLKDLYIDQLKDLYSACKQSHGVTVDMTRAATDEALVEALEDGADGIKDGMDTLAEILRSHGEDPTGEHCKGMEGLVTEARKHALEAEFGDDDVRDAAIITQYQRMAHYAIAGYGCVRTFAARLDLEDDEEKLQECLDATKDGDETMTEIAEGGVNEAAIDGV